MKNTYKIISVAIIIICLILVYAFKNLNQKDNIKDSSGMVNYSGYLDFNPKDFNSLLNNGKPIIIDFGADWCGPCKQFHPILEKVAYNHREDAYIKYVDVDKEGEFAKLYSVQAIPTQVFIMPDGSNYKPSSETEKLGLETIKQKSTDKVITYHIGALSAEEMDTVLADMKLNIK